jgi:hypothetical protein
LNIRSLPALLIVAASVAYAGNAFAQGAFPAPLPGQVQQNDPAFPPVPGQSRVQRSDPAFPPVNGAAPSAAVSAPPMAAFPSGGVAPMSGGFSAAPPPQGSPPADCMQQFTPLREDTEKRGKEIKAASDRHATPDVACKLIGGFSQAELKMLKYVEKNSARCGIPPQVTEQLKNGHKNTEVMLAKVCDAAKQAQRGPAGPTLSDVLGSSAALPEATVKKKGGSTFDTLSGNVLTR